MFHPLRNFTCFLPVQMHSKKKILIQFFFWKKNEGKLEIAERLPGHFSSLENRENFNSRTFDYHCGGLYVSLIEVQLLSFEDTRITHTIHDTQTCSPWNSFERLEISAKIRSHLGKSMYTCASRHSVSVRPVTRESRNERDPVMMMRRHRHAARIEEGVFASEITVAPSYFFLLHTFTIW